MAASESFNVAIAGDYEVRAKIILATSMVEAG